MKAGGFQQIHGSKRVDFEIQYGDIPGFIMRRLGSAVNDQVEFVRPKQGFERGSIANVRIEVRKIPGLVAKAFPIPRRITLLAEKHASHIVVDANHLMSLAVKMLDGLGTNQATGTGDEYLFHRWRNLCLQTLPNEILNN